MFCMSSPSSPLFPVILQLYLAIKAKVWEKTTLIYDYFHTNYGVTDNPEQLNLSKTHMINANSVPDVILVILTLKL